MKTQDEALKAEAIIRLLRFMPNQYLGGLIVVSGFIAYLAGKVPDRLLLSWGGLVLGLYVLGFAVLFALRHIPREKPIWTVFALGYGLGGGAVWGLLTILLEPYGGGFSHLLTPALIGLSGLGVAGLVSYMPSVAAFLVTALGPIAWLHWDARGMGGEHPVLAILVVACAVGFAVAAALSNRHLFQTWQYRRALEESEGRFRDFADSASEWYWETDADNRLTYISDSAVLVSRSARDAALGHRREDLSAEDMKQNPERWRDYLAAMAARESFRDFVYPLPMGKGGTELWISISGVPVFDLSGRFKGYRGTGKDLTGERAAAEQLKLAQSRLADAVESFPGAFLLFDANERLMLLNGTARDWYQPISDTLVEGARVEDIIRAFSADVHTSGMENAKLDQWVVWRLEQFRNPQAPHIQHLSDGRHTLVYETRLADGGTVSVRTDITDLVEAQTAAAEANRSKSEFLANMSHELRTPLNAIIGFADAILHEVSGPIGNETYATYLTHIHQSGEHLLSLISDILDVSAVEAGRIVLTPSPIHVPELINQCLALVRTRADDKGLAIGLNLPAEMPFLQADERRVKQVLINILNNAVKFTPEGGRVDMTVENGTGGDLSLVVRDTGPGLTPEEMAVALSPFGRTQYALETAQEGTGLGLPLSKSLMEAHGGQLLLSSEPGEGCTVRLVFPPDDSAEKAVGTG